MSNTSRLNIVIENARKSGIDEGKIAKCQRMAEESGLKGIDLIRALEFYLLGR